MKPKLYLLYGLPASGKTTFANKLHQETGAIIFSIDKLLIETFEFKTNDEFKQRYEDARSIIEGKTKSLIADGKSGILDFGFWKKQDRKEMIKKGESWGADVVIYYFKSDLATLHKRLDLRNKNLSKNTPLIVTHEFLDNFAKIFEPPIEDEAELIMIG